MKSEAVPGHLRFLAGYQLQAFDDHLKFRLRQFYVGISVLHEPEVPQVSNAINIGSMSNSVVQQGSPGATQNITMKVDEAKAAIAAIEATLATAGFPPIGFLTCRTTSTRSRPTSQKQHRPPRLSARLPVPFEMLSRARLEGHSLPPSPQFLWH
jgi:hypothetical protein